MQSSYEQLIIYYFSGTGNARHTAGWIAREAEMHGLRIKLVNIDHNEPVDIDAGRKNLIGLIGPTHGFNFPPIMLKFLCKFPKNNGADVFIINTRAGMKMGKLFLPGLGGATQYFAALVLWLKGYYIRGMQPMDLPSNWISIHPGLREKVVNSIFSRCEKISGNFIRKILRGETKYKALWSFPFDMAVAPIALLYFIIGRFAIAKTFMATSACTLCGLCEKQCPVNAIKMIRHRPYWTFNCESCMRCMNNCPERAIETTHSFSIVIWWLIISFVTPWFLTKIYNINIFSNEIFRSARDFFGNVLSWIVGLILLWISYELIHILLRFKFFDKLVAYTSFTKYKFWRRYKSPKTRTSLPKLPVEN